ncbi:MAG: hypothetical protein BGO47_12080 [Microbacterium sp. 67-17]|uniref:LLM class flavin-dependent oxidoreductase n=1 Tax=Microbacterium sp. 67-17 TaxID=1895782 RepID=UPI00095EAFF7|nr:LLM class flavin-dependent oxidoreductase [Microbacterium sp. 67-17]OJW02441.1 MAG: hypothetical protein BGO47_12080 [Microbacterium sp. 67-17]
MPTTNDGYILSKTSPSFMPSSELNVAVAVEAERRGFDFVLAMTKFRGYGDGDGFWDYSIDPLALCGMIIQATTTIGIWGSVAAPTIHPAMAARTAATYDDASGGRFRLNVVAGWNISEYSQMGLWPENYHADRYRYTREYIAVLRGLWESGQYSHDGEFFHLEDCIAKPTPANGVKIIVPGQSTNSLSVAADLADVNFVLGGLTDIATARAALLEATKNNGRAVESAALYGIITAPTDAEALDIANDFIAHTDFESAIALKRAALTDKGGNAAQRWLEQDEATRPLPGYPDDSMPVVAQVPAFFHPHIIGSHERVARYLDAVETKAGITSTVLSFPDFRGDLASFAENVMPRMTTLTPA